jgi:chemotaxis methyl-accepting protein methylase
MKRAKTSRKIMKIPLEIMATDLSINELAHALKSIYGFKNDHDRVWKL